MYRKTMLFCLKHGLYAVLLLALYTIQTNPYLFSIFGIKPLLVFPAVVVIAMQEGELTGAWYGAAAGALFDLSVNKIFGLNALLMVLCCVVIGLLVIYLVHFSMLNALLLTASAMLIRDIICYYFYYGMWGYSQSYRIFLGNMLPELLYTLALTPAVFLLFTHVKGKFDARLGD